jgi:hypothetical protein
MSHFIEFIEPPYSLNLATDKRRYARIEETITGTPVAIGSFVWTKETHEINCRVVGKNRYAEAR